MTVENPETARRISVIIPTTLGPVTVTGLIELAGEGGRSAMCLDGTTDLIGIASGYNAFVRRSTGVIHRLFGKTPLVNYRLDVSENVEAGASWQLSVLLAHALWADGRLDTGAGAGAPGPLVWATGAISPVDFAVGSVGHVADKLRNSRDLFQKAIAAGRAIHIFLPQENDRDIEPDIAAWLSERNLKPVLLVSADAALAALGLPGIPRAASRSDEAATTIAGNPYRGLQPYQREHRALFFGRAKAREEALEQLRVAAGHGRPFLLVHGQSGVGKSSLVQAGLAADVEERAHEGGRFRSAVIVPSQGGDNPVAALCHGLRAMLDGPDNEPEARSFANTPDEAIGLLETLRASASSGSVKQSGLLIIDQLEEIFEPTIRAERAVEFGELVERIVASRVVWVVCTMRADALGQLDRVPALAHLASPERVYRLDRPSRFELSEIVAAPAALAGKTFSNRTIPESFADIAAASPDSLPLLQSVLYLFFDQADEKGQLTAEGLKRIGGFEGAVGRWADQVRDDIIRNGAASVLVDQVLVSLVRIEPETRRPLARSVSYKPEGEHGQVLRQLASTRLVSLFDGTEGPRARLAHEVLATHWPHLANLVEKLGAAMILRDDFEARTKVWIVSGREEAELLRGPARLDTAQNFLREALVPFEAGLTDYIDASVVAAREETRKIERLANAELERARVERDAATEKSRAARRFQWFLATASIVLAAFTVFAGWQWYQAIDAREAAIVAVEKEKNAAESALAAAEKERISNDNAQAAAKRADEQAEKAVIAETEARRQLQAARINEARFIAGRAEQMMDENIDLARLALLEILPKTVQGDETRPLVPETVTALARINTAKLPSMLQQNIQMAISPRIFTPDWKYMISIFAPAFVTINDVRTGALMSGFPTEGVDILDAQFSPNGKYALITAKDGAARLWEVQTGKKVATYRSGQSPFSGTRFTAGSDKITTVAMDGTIAIWEEGYDGDPLHQFQITQRRSETGMLFPASGTTILTPDETRLVFSAIGDDDKLYDVENEELIATLDGSSGNVMDNVVSKDGQRLVNAGKDRSARIWDTKTGALVRTLEGHTNTVGGAFFAAGGAQVLTYSSDGSAKLWDTSTGEVIHTFFDQSGPVLGATMSPDGNTLATWSQDKALRLWDVKTETVKRKIIGHALGFAMAVFSPDGRRLATSAPQSPIEIWDLEEMPPVLSQSSIPGQPGRTGISPDGTMLMVTTYKKTGGYKLDLVSADNGALIRTLADTLASEPIGMTTVFSPDGTRIATSTSDGRIDIWETATGKKLRSISDPIMSLEKPSFSPDNRRMVALTNFNGAVVRDVGTGAAIANLVGHGGPLASASFSPDGLYIVTAAADNTVRVWNADSGESVEALPAQRFAALDAIFSPDGRRVLFALADLSAQIWEVGGLNRVKPLSAQVGVDIMAASGNSMGFSSDGLRAAFISSDASVRILDTQTGGQLERIAIEDAYPVSLAYGASRTRIASISPMEIRISEVGPGASQKDLLAREHLLPYRTMSQTEQSDFFPNSDRGSASAPLAAINPCDRLASNPADLRRPPGPAVEFSYISGWEAMGACNNALKNEPDNIRYQYQLGRAFSSLGRHKDANQAFQAAADRGYAIAYEGLGFAFQFGWGAPQDLVAAREMFQKAIDLGSPSAYMSLASMAQQGLGEPPNPVKARGLIETAADLGVTYAHEELARGADRGAPGRAPDLEAALFHYAAATILYEQAGDENLAQRNRFRRGSLARALRVEQVSAVWEKILEWRKKHSPKE